MRITERSTGELQMASGFGITIMLFVCREVCHHNLKNLSVYVCVCTLCV